ncbi:DUF1624 domain-containing protein [Phenylobacterium sp.]|jgi:uncharacterized membrane protein|uniref:DUF1624 domain-containing protein n=1 Tax=Phenylobacterium sp. TaxID=1871053 RepID=UPI002F92D4BD
MQTPASPSSADAAMATGRPPDQRLASIDLLRGLVMVIMVLDHVRDFFHDQALAFDPLDLERTYPLLYATRWITHFCAPVFVFLAGVSAWLQFARGKTRLELSRFLLTRGLWLVLMELTVISFGWHWRLDFLFLQVIWAIGWSMVALAGLVWLPWKVVLAVGAGILLGHNLLDGVQAQDLGAAAPAWALLHQQAPILIAGKLWGLVAYPLLPWIGVMALGYGLGPAFLQPERRRHVLLLGLGGGMVLLFVLLRATQVYGDPDGWRVWPAPGRTAMDFLSTTKYPPSLLYACMTLGPALLLLPALEKLKGRWAEPWATFGAVPFFFYIAHIYLAHAASSLLALAQGYPAWGVSDIFRNGQALQGFGLPLAWTYLIWVAAVVALYLPCRWFAGVKRRHPGGVLSYL